MLAEKRLKERKEGRTAAAREGEGKVGGEVPWNQVMNMHQRGGKTGSFLISSFLVRSIRLYWVLLLGTDTKERSVSDFQMVPVVWRDHLAGRWLCLGCKARGTKPWSSFLLQSLPSGPHGWKISACNGSMEACPPESGQGPA